MTPTPTSTSPETPGGAGAPEGSDEPDAGRVPDDVAAPQAQTDTAGAERAGAGVSHASVLPVGSAPLSGGGPSAPGRRSHRLRYLGVAAVLVGAVAFLLVQGLGSSLDYYLTVDQAVHQKATLGTKEFRLEGVVVPHSVHDTGHGVNFDVSSNGVSAPVTNTTSPPQLFQENIPVVLVGHFVGNRFVSNQILVKHSSQYQAAHPDRVAAPNGSKR